ncbi:hypothetical protein GCM10022235_24070 [Kribbella ginsengisoli]|uniref:Uncharacterized protein n=1 Tax=Kribbella ginsengisoli TaxID=363865 RepID=A0ABP6WRS6_9ACTN
MRTEPPEGRATFAMVHRVAVLGLLLVLTGCSSPAEEKGAAPQPSSAPTTTPVPTRVLVIWSDVMCSTIGELTSAQADLASLNQNLTGPSRLIWSWLAGCSPASDLWSVSRRRNSVRWEVLVPLT